MTFIVYEMLLFIVLQKVNMIIPDLIVATIKLVNWFDDPPKQEIKILKNYIFDEETICIHYESVRTIVIL